MGAGYLACSFDLLNVRDLDLIRQASAQCSRLTVGVYSDEFAEAVTGRPPIVPFAERAELVSFVRGVAEVVAHDSDRAFLGPKTVLFEVSGRASALRAGRIVELVAARESASAVLQKVLPSIRGAADAAVA